MAITYTSDLEHINWVALKAELEADNFHNGRSAEQYRLSFERSLSVVALDGDRPIGTVRALSDGICNAHVIDVWTQSSYRNQGIATHMMRLLLAQLPGQHVSLWTDDAGEFYQKLGFKMSRADLYETVVGKWLHNERPTTGG